MVKKTGKTGNKSAIAKAAAQMSALGAPPSSNDTPVEIEETPKAYVVTGISVPVDLLELLRELSYLRQRAGLGREETSVSAIVVSCVLEHLNDFNEEIAKRKGL